MKTRKMRVHLGCLLNRLPYRLLPYIGRIYGAAQKDIDSFENQNRKQEIIFDRVRGIVEYAINNNKFYQDFYASKGFTIDQLRSFEDIDKIPIVTKQELMNVDIEMRSSVRNNRYLANTGGSTGRSFSLYKTPELKIKEFAYFHRIWKKLNYEKHDLRLHFVGRNQFVGIYRYDFIENSIQVSVNTPFEDILGAIRNDNLKIRYLHGYPSVLYEFALFCKEHTVDFELSGLNKNLKGVFLKSEYPFKCYRDEIESTFGVKTLSHYGHTETVALAYEAYTPFIYDVLQSYGYVEVSLVENDYRIIATTYDNYASPLIRYDTEDIVEDPCWKDGIITRFRMKNGRSGDFILDKNGKKISLTGFLFGKHHKLYYYASQVQISQRRKGEAILYYVPIKNLPPDFDASRYFDCSDEELDVTFLQIEKPIKTKSGKVLLKIYE